MIDEARTLELFGYTRDDLSKGSHKKIVSVCGECGSTRYVRIGAYRDLCHSCALAKANKKRAAPPDYMVRSIDDAETFRRFGHHAYDLSPNSAEMVVAVCVGCGKVRETPKQFYADLCRICTTKIPITETTRQKQSIAHTGVYPSFETRKKQSESHRGARNYNWKGGMTPWRSMLWNSQPYKAWRRSVFERDDYTCQMCGDDTGGNLQAHHIHPVRDNKNTLLIFDTNNGITLCKGCHENVNGCEYDFIDMFERILFGNV